MYLLGTFVASRPMRRTCDDIDFFTFPALDPTIGADALDAPIDGFMMAAKPKDDERAKALLTWLGSQEAGTSTCKTDPTTLVANSGVDTARYTALQKKAAELVGDGEVDRAVPRPRHPAGLRLDRHDPRRSRLPEEPRRTSTPRNASRAQKKSIFTA